MYSVEVVTEVIFTKRKIRREYIWNDVRQKVTYIYTDKISTVPTSVGLASARPNKIVVKRSNE